MTADPRVLQSTDMSYLERLTDVTDAGNDIIRQKTLTYGPSWKMRGGQGAWFTMVRPWDRLEKIVGAHGGDIFTAISADASGADGSALACVRDLRNYLTLTEAEMASRGVVDLPLRARRAPEGAERGVGPAGAPAGAGEDARRPPPDLLQIRTVLHQALARLGLTYEDMNITEEGRRVEITGLECPWKSAR